MLKKKLSRLGDKVSKQLDMPATLRKSFNKGAASIPRHLNYHLMGAPRALSKEKQQKNELKRR